MGKVLHEAIERYLGDLNRWSDAVLDEIARTGAERSLPLIDPEVGTFLGVIARSIGARRILEIGTAIGYSGIWLARALPPGGVLLTMERDADRAAEARRHFERAGVSDRASVMVGDAMRLVSKVAGPFDLIFQDGDKMLYEPLLDKLVARLRTGGVLITDNVLWSGEVVPGYLARPERDEESTRAIASYNRALAAHPSLMTSTLPLRDGVAMSVKTA